MMKPCQTLKKKAPNKGREKETKGKDQSLGKQTTQKSWDTSKGTFKYQNPHQSLEAYQLKKGEVNLMNPPLQY